MKTVFKSFLILIATTTVFAQKQKVYRETISTEGLSSLEVRAENTALQVKTSTDNQLHFNFSIEFFNYDKKEVNTILEGITTEVLKKDDRLVFTVNSQKGLGRVVYEIDSPFGLFMDHSTFKSGDGKERRFRKTKADLVQLITQKEKHEKTIAMIKKYLENGEVEDINLEDEKHFKVSFVIEVPEQIELHLNLKESNLDVLDDITQPVFVYAQDAEITAKKMHNFLNEITLEDGNFKTTHIIGGRYKFKSVSKVIIGEIADAEIESEFSDLSIGEMRSPINITDYNSTFWLYDLIPSETQYHLSGEYSEINVYYPSNNTDYTINTVGFNTAHFLENIRTDIPPNRENKPTKMLVAEKLTSGSKPVVAFEIEIQHGIVRLGKDFIEIR
jgi:hypothetical protein